jgi:hypothetical protein
MSFRALSSLAQPILEESMVLSIGSSLNSLRQLDFTTALQEFVNLSAPSSSNTVCMKKGFARLAWWQSNGPLKV